MEYVRPIDFDALARVAGRASESVLDRDSGATTSAINVIKTPPGDGSPAGLHRHPFDQVFYVVSGTMSVEIDGELGEAGPGTIVVFPAGVPHRNWNAGTEATVHLAINTPLPDPGVPFAETVER